LLAALSLAPTRRLAAETELTSQGELELETRVFPDDQRAGNHDRTLSLFSRVGALASRGWFSTRLRGFGRVDAFDRQRALLVLEEGWFQARSGPTRLRVGYDLVNWSVLEGFHPADTINARSLDSDIENPDKVGEPLASLQLSPTGWLTLTALALPHFVAPVLPSPRSRLGFTGGGPTSPVIRRSCLGLNGRVGSCGFAGQGAGRLELRFPGVDIAAMGARHLDRSQPLVIAGEEITFIHLYVDDLAATLQGALRATVLKFEVAHRRFHDLRDPRFAGLASAARNHTTVAAGVEYASSHDWGGQSTIYAEAQVLLGPPAEIARALTMFQRDAFLGYRLAFNDEDGREFLLFAVGDLETRDELLVSVGYRQRLGESWGVRAALRLIVAPAADPPTGLRPFREADHFRFTLTRHF
jgi:hypothetical protein